MASPGTFKQENSYSTADTPDNTSNIDFFTEQYHKAQLHISEARGKFYDRVTLLASGAIVLSFSFFATLTSKASFVHIMLVLFVAWGFLLACILCCVFRNPPYHKYILYAYAFYFSDAMKKQKLKELAIALRQHFPSGNVDITPETDIQKQITHWDGKNKELSRKALQFHRHYRIMEQGALTFFLVGLFLLGLFAMKNVIANPHSMIK